MIQQTPQADLFKQQLRDSLQRETLNIVPSKSRDTLTSTPVARKTRWSTSSKAGKVKLAHALVRRQRMPAGDPRGGRYFRGAVPVGIGPAGNRDAMEDNGLETGSLCRFFERLSQRLAVEGFVST